MNTNQKFNALLVLCMFVGLVTIGCNQSTSTSELTDVKETTVAANTDSGCCGKCATGQKPDGETEGCCGKCATEQVAAKTQEGECGSGCNACAEGDSATCKCEGESTTGKPKTAAANMSKEGCCGKCQAETTGTAKDQDEACGNCKACVEGDSSKCKCEGDQAVDETATDKQVKTHAQDRDIFHFLLENHQQLTRKVTELDNGVETLTESLDATIARKIQEHVASMYARIEDGRRIRMWDSLYQEVFKHADKIEMKLENTENGIKVIETSDDPYVVKLIQAHAKVVSGFVENGFEEARKNHEPPKQ